LEAAGLGPLLPAAVWRGRDPVFLRLLAGAGADLEGVRRESGERAYPRPSASAATTSPSPWPGSAPHRRPIRWTTWRGRRRGDRAGAMARMQEQPQLRERLIAEHAELLPRSAADGDDAEVALLHDLGVALAVVGAMGAMGATALHRAAWWGRAWTVRLLLDRGAEPVATAPSTGTRMTWAIHGSAHSPAAHGHGDHVEVARLPLDAGVELRGVDVGQVAGEPEPWLEEVTRSAAAQPPRLAADPHAWARRDHDALSAYLLAVAAVPHAVRERIGDGFAVRTGAPSDTENGTVAGRATDNEIAAALALLRGVPAQWPGPPPPARGSSRGWSRRRRARARRGDDGHDAGPAPRPTRASERDPHRARSPPSSTCPARGRRRGRAAAARARVPANRPGATRPLREGARGPGPAP
jgi:hypothetical protein